MMHESATSIDWSNPFSFYSPQALQIFVIIICSFISFILVSFVTFLVTLYRLDQSKNLLDFCSDTIICFCWCQWLNLFCGLIVSGSASAGPRWQPEVPDRTRSALGTVWLISSPPCSGYQTQDIRLRIPDSRYQAQNTIIKILHLRQNIKETTLKISHYIKHTTIRTPPRTPHSWYQTQNPILRKYCTPVKIKIVLGAVWLISSHPWLGYLHPSHHNHDNHAIFSFSISMALSHSSSLKLN